MPTKEEFAAELRMSETEKAIAKMREVLVDLDDLEADLARAEDTAWQPHWSRDAPISDRLRRVGVSERAIAKVEALFAAMDAIRNGKQLAPEIGALLADLEQAEESAAAQLKAIVERRRD